MTPVAAFIQHCAGRSSGSNEAKKKTKYMQIEKEEIELSVFAAGMTVYLENPKAFVKNNSYFLELTSGFSRVTRYKMKVQKSILFVDTTNEHIDGSLKNVIPCTIRQKYSDVNLTKHVWDLYAENGQTLMKKF